MRGRITALVAALGLVAGPAWGQVTPVPNGLNVSVLRPSAININWVVRGTPGGQATSTVGLFQPFNPGTNPRACTPGTAIGTVGSAVTTVVGANGSARAVETLVIPSTVADRALKLGLNQFFYCRVFTGTALPPGGAANTVTCRQGSSAFAAFSIGRVELFFENQRRDITVPQGQPNLKVFADVAYNGSGILRAVWEVAEAGAVSAAQPTVSAPPATFSTPVDPNLIPPTTAFRTLEVINQFVGFGDRVLLTLTGELPTTQPGTYIVNLRFTEPPVGFAVPVATYFVKAQEHVQRVSPIALQAPGQSAVLGLKPFAFRWEPAPKVAHYRLDVYPQDAGAPPAVPGVIQGPATQPGSDPDALVRAARELGDPVLSVQIPSQVSSFTPRAGQLGKLAAGRRYLWQVKGFDQQGNVVAESSLRQFTLQR